MRALVLIPGGAPQAYWYDLGPLTLGQALAGSLVTVPLRNRQVSGVILETREIELDFATKDILGLAPNAEQVPLAYLEFLRWMSDYYLTPLPVVLATCLPKSAQRYLFHPPKRKRKAEAKLKAKPEAPVQGAEKPEAESPSAEVGLHPNAEQGKAIAEISGAIDSAVFAPYLLHGITGSGKTLVYLHLAQKALALGRRVLILVPEIGLTPQTVQRFESFLDRKVAAYHSNLPEAQRRALWQGLFSGAVDLVIGPRSAALLPLDNVGLIVVDEEHDASFKQDQMAPRYHARDLALWRGRQFACPVVLGSATPSLETYHAAESGRYRKLALSERATGAKPPAITVVDMRRQWELQGNQILSIPLRDSLQAALERGEQAILFLNRRGYSPRRVCGHCGIPRPCRKCAVPLVFHKKRGLLLCHHCGYSIPSETPCPECGHRSYVDAGRGLEQIEETLKDLFPKFKVERLDRDITQVQGGPEALLDRFRKGEIQLLLGTQMVAKGHDFPGVTLVGVLDGDAGLGLADFRAQERAFQLITQVSGRAGRHNLTGKVILQTSNPDNAILAFALNHDYPGFYQDEIARRSELGYPPFVRLLLIELSCPVEKDLLASMTALAAAMLPLAESAEVEILGPVPAALRKLHGEWRGHILLKGRSANRMRWLVEQSRNMAERQFPKKVKLRLDMDPQTLQ